MNDQVLTIDQMQELIKLGIDISKASLYWYETDETNFVCFGTDMDKDCGDEVCPTFTLYDILNMLPKSIDYYPLKIQSYGGDFNVINFGYWKGERAGWLHFCQDMHSTINSAYELLKWTKENGHI